jgi:HEPN domain-containing protein
MANENPVVAEWIAKADADWQLAAIARAAANPKLLDGVVYHAQQCVEKLLKARLIQLGQTIRKTHDLASLSQALQGADEQWRWDESELDDLSDAGVMNRYPGFDTSEQEMQELMEVAGRLRQALLNDLGTIP